MDVVIPVRPGDHNPSLVLALRSIYQNFPHGRIWLAGYMPRWVNTEKVGYIPVPQAQSHWRNVLHIMENVACHPEVTDTFTFFNDDFYVLGKVKNVPIMYEGTMQERARRLRGLSLGEYSRGAIDTLELLQKAGYENPWNFDLHMPLPMDKESVGGALELLPVPYRFWPHFRSIVGAVGGYEGVPGKDVKITGVAPRIPIGYRFLSTSVRSLGAGQVGRELRQLFPGICPLEKAYKEQS
jgi:hypothetical protein